jgi:TolB-like protein
MPEDRRLAAIMFTDIVGYTRLMGTDEEKAVDMLSRNRTIHQSCIEKFNGTLIKEIGDGTLASFPLASDAVRCAVEIQKACKEQGIPLKIGIHEGEMIFSGSDVIGDGVNIASRLQEDAQEGCINISASVYRDIKNKADIRTKLIGERSFKNVDEHVKVYHVLHDDIASDSDIRNQNRHVSSKENSIIVLPFVNMSPDPDQEYFSDGLTEEIITDLSFIQDLLVISRSSAMTFKGAEKKLKEIAKEVNVRYVLEGSVRKARNNLRITAQLIDASTDAHLWAEKYSGTLDDVFDIQEKVSRSIADALKIKLSSNEIESIEKRKVNDVIAYEHYLLARNEIWTCTKESLSHAIQLLNSSLDKIGRNEYLLVALGTAYFQYVNAGIDPEKQHLDKAEEALEEALEINPSLSKAYYLKSLIHETRGELRDAFNSIKHALLLDPNDSEALMMMAFMYALVGKPEKGKPFGRHAIETDPLSPIVYSGEWWINSSEGRFDKVLETCLKMYNLDKDNLMSIWAYAYALAFNYKVRKSTKLLDSLIVKHPDQFLSMIGKALRHAINDEKQEAIQSVTEQVEKAAEMDHMMSWVLADVYSLIGEKDKAIDYLERATKDIFIDYPFFSKHDPFLENIRGEERFEKLMEEVKYKWENFKD